MIFDNSTPLQRVLATDPSMPWTWVGFGPWPKTGEDRQPMRICPICACLVPNEDGLLTMHQGTHR